MKVANSVGTNLSGMPTAADAAEAEAIMSPLIPAAEQYQAQLAAIKWQPGLVSDAHVLIAQITVLDGVVKSVAQQTASSMKNWFSQYASAAEAVSSASNILRHDLGLPPLS